MALSATVTTLLSIFESVTVPSQEFDVDLAGAGDRSGGDR
jgi:hypothetical protein